MRVKVFLFTFYLNGRFHAVSVEKLTEQISNFWTVRFLKIKSEPNLGFPHIPMKHTINRLKHPAYQSMNACNVTQQCI